MTSPAAHEADPPPLSAGTWASLRDRDTTFIEVKPDSQLALRSATSAARDVGKNFNFIGSDNPAEEVALGRLTVGHYGHEMAAPSEPSRVDPLIKNRLVWLVVQQGLDLPLYGPPGTTGSYRGGVWTAVDARTGEVLLSESLLYPPDYKG